PAPRLQPSAANLPPVKVGPAPEPHEWPVKVARAREPEEQPIAWKQPAAAVGALVAGVALIGAWAGWDAGNAIEQEQPDHAVTVALPKANALPPAAVADAPPRDIFAQPQRRAHST